MSKQVPLSVLDVVPLRRGCSPSTALAETLALAKYVEKLGYYRYWFAEHHGMPGIGSSAPAVLIGQVAAATSTMRVGSGGVMLPNHASLAIAEQFGTLEALFPGRIDLGLGRAPGSERVTAHALRQSTGAETDADFPRQLDELFHFFRGDFPTDHLYRRIHAMPARGHEPPVWLLGSSDFSAKLAGRLGLPFAFAHHFSQHNTLPALAYYRQFFKPSEALQKPQAMVAAIVVVADTDAEAQRLALPNALAFIRLRQGAPGPYPTVEEAENHRWSLEERAFAEQWLSLNIVGNPDTVKRKLTELLESTNADELMVLCAVPDPAARHRSYELLREIHGP